MPWEAEMTPPPHRPGRGPSRIGSPSHQEGVRKCMLMIMLTSTNPANDRATSPTRTWKTLLGTEVEAKEPGERSLRRTTPPPRAWSPASSGPRWPRSQAPSPASSPTRRRSCASRSAAPPPSRGPQR
ncbi:CD99 antigen isoform X3 [Alexandromys fortis]|uniref:CD99 antigen isoform X3 n=1 Tax=Alexandromys fortis TaxID=100897 RepID=UPI00215346AF|nr:CD99 antigen isoform X3 [Microtus fortis]